MAGKNKNNILPVQDGVCVNGKTEEMQAENLQQEQSADPDPKENGEQAEQIPDVKPSAKKKKVQSVPEKPANNLRAAEIFASNTAAELYFTADGSAFTNRNFAEVHARALKNESIETIKRTEENATKNQD